MSFFPSDPESEATLISILEQMLTQLKISNAHLEIVSDTVFTEEDMESE